ncbi:MAG TPA: nucleotidyltransferase domain-containing protein [Azospirillum sp.]|nr:nucleotidyltransferase domain-containing protein [Azospirillum sp.]
MTVPLSQQERDALHAFEARMRTRYGARLRGLVLFGSRARRDHRDDSDLDVAVVLAAPITDMVAEALSMADDAFDVLLEQGLHIQPMPIEEGSLDHPEAHPIPHLTRCIARDGVAL